MRRPSCLFNGNAPFLENLYSSYLSDPDSVSSEWRDYFNDFDAIKRKIYNKDKFEVVIKKNIILANKALPNTFLNCNCVANNTAPYVQNI